MPLIPVQDLSHPLLAPYANMRDAELAQRQDPLNPAAHAGLFVAEGHLVLRRLLTSRYRTQSVLLADNRADELAPDLARLDPATPVFVAPQALFNDIVGFNMHRGVLAIGERGRDLSLADLLARPGPMLVLEDTCNHDNLGGIFRNAAALAGPGCSILLSPRSADPLYRKSLRVSMGTILAVPFARADAWPDALTTLAAAGFETWALTPKAGAIDLPALTADLRARPRKIALVLGSEGPGLTEAALAACTHRVKIPMFKAAPEVDSLNVAMAAGIALYGVGMADGIPTEHPPTLRS